MAQVFPYLFETVVGMSVQGGINLHAAIDQVAEEGMTRWRWDVAVSLTGAVGQYELSCYFSKDIKTEQKYSDIQKSSVGN